MSAKTIIVIRHGESEWNATPRPSREEWYFKYDLEKLEQEAHNNKLLECRLRDARMTAKGKAQCEELRKLLLKLEAVKNLKPELVVVSPLTRAMETASLVFADSDIPVQLWPGMQEHVVNICDVGRPVSSLKEEFPKYDFSHMQDAWWTVPMAKETPQAFQQRISAFQSWLRALPQKVVVLVGHGHFLREFLKGTPAESAYMRNTEVRIVDFPALDNAAMTRMDTAIVVCGLKIQLDGPSLQVLTERVKLAKKLYSEHNTTTDNSTTQTVTNNSIVIMTGGSTSQQVLTAEGSVMKVIAVHEGIPPERIFVEDRSVDTIENAAFVKVILDKTNIKKILLVTSEYHQQRALMVFQRVFGDSYTISAHGASSSSLPADVRSKTDENEKYYISILDDLFAKYAAAQASNQGS